MENEPLIPPEYPEQPHPTLIVPPKGALDGMPSPSTQSWGVIISIIIIVLMIVIGAFYSWGKRISESVVMPTASTTSY